MTTDPKGTVSLLEKINGLAKSSTVDNDFPDEATRTQFVEAAGKLAITASCSMPVALLM